MVSVISSLTPPQGSCLDAGPNVRNGSTAEIVRLYKRVSFTPASRPIRQFDRSSLLCQQPTYPHRSRASRGSPGRRTREELSSINPDEARAPIAAAQSCQLAARGYAPVADYPASQLHELLPGHWKQHYTPAVAA
jgi:hypothetical protein